MRVRILCTILHMCMLYTARMQLRSMKMVKCSCSRSISKCFYKTFFLCSYWIHLSKMRPYCVFIYYFFFSNFVHAWMVSIAHLSDVEMCICVFFVLRFWFWSYTQQIHFKDSDVYAVFVVQSDMRCTPISTRGPFLLSLAFHLTEFTLALSCHLYGTPGA